MYGAMQGFVQCLGKYEGDPFETMFLKIEKQEPPQPQPQVGAVYVCMMDEWICALCLFLYGREPPAS
jgi:hypothetical protein